MERRPQIQAWLRQDHLLLTKVHELLAREGLSVAYSSLHRFAQKWCEFGNPSSITVRRVECTPGEMAGVDFGRLGLLQELGSNRPRMVHAFIMILGHSRLSRVIPTFRQDLETIIDFPPSLSFELKWSQTPFKHVGSGRPRLALDLVVSLLTV